jgi:hypothetical protein
MSLFQLAGFHITAGGQVFQSQLRGKTTLAGKKAVLWHVPTMRPRAACAF